MSVSVDPIGPWPLVVAAALAVTGLTIWAYRVKLRGTTGRWRWLALGLRLLAVLLCVLAALRPSVVVSEKKNEAASLVVLLDSSLSMRFTDEVRDQSRWEVANRTLDEARKAVKGLPEAIDTKFFFFNSGLEEIPDPDAPAPTPKAEEPKAKAAAPASPGEPAERPDGRETALGSALLEAIKRQAGKRVAMIVVLSDGAGNAGVPPSVAAQQLRGQDVPVVAVGFGSETAGAASRDIAVKGLEAGPTVFVKNRLEARGQVEVRGFPNQDLEVELLVEGEPKPVAKTTVRAREDARTVPVSGLVYTPETPGEKKVTLRVATRDKIKKKKEEPE